MTPQNKKRIELAALDNQTSRYATQSQKLKILDPHGNSQLYFWAICDKCDFKKQVFTVFYDKPGFSNCLRDCVIHAFKNSYG